MERVEFTRDCEAIEIPDGRAVRIAKGTVAFVTRAIEGAFTLQVPAYGGLFRIEGKDADAIGKEVTREPVPNSEGVRSLDQEIWEQLRSCYDPEIPVNIVDLGLIYDLGITASPDGGSIVDVKMTLTAPGCGMGDFIVAEVKQKLNGLPGVTEVNVEIVLDPPWSPQMMSPEARERIDML